MPAILTSRKTRACLHTQNNSQRLKADKILAHMLTVPRLIDNNNNKIDTPCQNRCLSIFGVYAVITMPEI
jgi:hypothetical protein